MDTEKLIHIDIEEENIYVYCGSATPPCASYKHCFWVTYKIYTVYNNCQAIAMGPIWLNEYKSRIRALEYRKNEEEWMKFL